MKLDVERINRFLAPTALVAAVSAWFFKAFISGADLLWHLASGREIWRRGSVPTVDPFSFTFGGQEWQNHEWLWDVLYWGAYRVTPDAAAWLNVGVLLAIFVLTFVIARRISESRLAAGVAVWMAAASIYWFLDIRPHLFTLLFMSFVLLTRERRWAWWTWPLLMVVWANLHAGFVFGMGVIGLSVLMRTLETSWQERRVVIPWKEWLGVGLCLLAWVFNPWGWRIMGYPLAYLADTGYRNLIEWHPPGFGLDPTFFEGRFWWFVLLAATGVIVGGYRRNYLIALSGVTLAMAMTSRRFIPLFVVASTPLVAIAIARARDALAKRVAVLRSPGAGLAASLVALGIAAVMWSSVRIEPSLLRHWVIGDGFPEAAVRYLKALGPPERVLNHYNWGGLLMLEAPGTKVFMDGRANTLYDEVLYADYLECLSGRPSPELLARYPADVALLPDGTFAAALLQQHPPWQLLYQDSQAVILAPPGSPLLTAELPASETVLADETETRLRMATAVATAGRPDQGIEILEEAVALDPLATRAWGQLSKFYARTGNFGAAAETIRRAVRLNPRRRVRLRVLEGTAYLSANDPRRALEVFRANPSTGPFNRRDEREAYLRQLEEQLQ